MAAKKRIFRGKTKVRKERNKEPVFDKRIGPFDLLSEWIKSDGNWHCVDLITAIIFGKIQRFVRRADNV
jgi:hypothetical protein